MFARLLPPGCLISLLLLNPFARGASAGDDSAAAELDRSIAAAEGSLQRHDLGAAERHYRAALFEGFLLLGTLDGLDGRRAEARAALQAASQDGAGDPARLPALATAYLQLGDGAPAIEILAAQKLIDARALRLLARALAASGERAAALDRLGAASAQAAGDPEILFLLATDYLRLKEPAAAARLFALVATARPIPQTLVLIGRAYRDASEYECAGVALRAALAQDKTVRHAHYYLGMLLRADPRVGIERRDDAIAQFREELKLAPSDPATNDQLGLTLLESERLEEALPALELAVRVEPRPLYAYHLGRCLLGLNRPAEAASLLKKALELTGRQDGDVAELDKIHYQLGLALRKLGEPEAAAAHFVEARRLAAVANPLPEDGVSDAVVPLLEPSSLSESSVAERRELKARVVTALCRSYLNLGVLQAQQQRFEPAAALFRKAANLDPDFPAVQSSLGIAWFNARRFAEATGPLQRAHAANPNDAGVSRMLALAWLNTQEYTRAADLLQVDPEREIDPSLQSAYGLALLKSGRAPEAERVFAELLARHGESAELRVFLGQAQAQQGRFDSAIVSLEHALALQPEVAEASATLGGIYLKQGRLPEAIVQLEAAVRLTPDEAEVHEHLAQAYQRTGQASLSEQHFDTFHKLEAKKRGSTP